MNEQVLPTPEILGRVTSWSLSMLRAVGMFLGSWGPTRKEDLESVRWTFRNLRRGKRMMMVDWHDSFNEMSPIHLSNGLILRQGVIFNPMQVVIGNYVVALSSDDPFILGWVDPNEVGTSGVQ